MQPADHELGTPQGKLDGSGQFDHLLDESLPQPPKGVEVAAGEPDQAPGYTGPSERQDELLRAARANVANAAEAAGTSPAEWEQRRTELGHSPHGPEDFVGTNGKAA
jgi:hypothetical protein